MRKATLLVVFVAMMVGVASAQTPLLCDQLVQGQETLADVIATGSLGCQIGDKIFSDFAYSQIIVNGAGTLPGSTSNINFTPVITNPQLVGFELQSLWQVNGALDLALKYNVATVSGQYLITDAHYTVFGVQNGTVGGAETICLGDVWQSDCEGSDHVNLSPNPDGSHNSVVFDPVNTVGIVKDLSFVSTSGTTGEFSIIRQRISQSEVPEPATFLLMGSGLLGLGLVRRYRRGRQ